MKRRFDFIVIGATGEQGSIASRDLLESGYRVLLCGRRRDTLRRLLKNPRAAFAPIDLRDIRKTALTIKASGSSIVVNCAELTWNLKAMEAALIAHTNYLDLGGLQQMTIKQFHLDRAFKKGALLALLGCGSTPGIANVMASYAVNQLDSVDHIDLGFAWDSNVKKFVLPYSFESIAYELTVVPVVLENGKLKTAKACALEGITRFLGVGNQTTYCVVHSEVYTFYRYFKSKGIKSVHYKAGFPAHSYRILSTLMELGFASQDEITVNGKKIRIIDFTSSVLHHLPRPKKYAETEDIWVKVFGEKNGRPVQIAMDCLVQPTPGWSTAGSNVDTGRTISVMAQMILRGQISATGVSAPESCVPQHEFFEELRKRGMKIYRDGRLL